MRPPETTPPALRGWRPQCWRPPCWRRQSGQPWLALAGMAACLLAPPAPAQTVRTVQATSLRSERAPDAAALAALPADAAVNLLQLSGGWAQVQMVSIPANASGGKASPAGLRGWLRASLLDLRAPEVAVVSQLETGRRAQGASAVTLGSRALSPRSNRHALIIGIGSYQVDAARRVEPLDGLAHDMSNALAMAATLQVPAANITLLRDEAATHDGIAEAVRELEARTLPGDRVFIYWSGHGSRHFDATEGGCVETLVPYDLKDVSNRQLARWIKPIGDKADKLLVVYDACHSAGVAAPLPGGATRSGATAAATATATSTSLRPKYAPGTDACQVPSNLRTLSLGDAAAALGLSAQDVVHVSSSRSDEVSLQAASSGGLATTALRQCLQGEARDADGSGSVSVQELADCAQAKIDRSLLGNAQYGAPHITLSGNRDFVPAWFANAVAVAVAGAVPVPGGAPPAVAAGAASGAVADPPAVSIGRVLGQIHEQRDSKRSVVVRPTRERLRIGADALGFSVTSGRAGHVYVALLGSDGETLTLLFPNALDAANTIGAGETLTLPRANWRISAGGPPGTDTLLVLVADGPRDLLALRGGKAGPFVQPLTDAQGRARLQWLMGTSASPGAAGECTGSLCSDAFGSALIRIEEY